ncbi:MAG: tetratricopeptide repeat protein [Thermoanaerobaculales bacterium]|nr:tetratricopeptide repeat protein [Thermoanaerobaculales bacterium]
MKYVTAARTLAIGLALLATVASATTADPIFVKWLVADNPGDETIRYYWQQAEAGGLGPEELVDLGTMLFYRGWSKDSVEYFKQALDADPELFEAWFRIGLVKHDEGDLSGARSAYKKCLKIRPGHGWANFYLGLLEEQTGNGKAAMDHYETAFQHAPELADPKVNPEILSSRLQIGAQVRHYDRRRFEAHTPMPYLEPGAVRKVRSSFEPRVAPTPTPTPTPIVGPRVAPTPTPAPDKKATAKKRKAAAGGGAASARSRSSGGSRGGRAESEATVPDHENTPFGFGGPAPTGSGAGGTGTGSTAEAAPDIGDTSPEASLGPGWSPLYRVAALFV